MKFRILTNQIWMFWAGGMVVWPFMIFKMRYPSEQLFKHELKHCYQVKEQGILKFYFMYILRWLRYGYRKHPAEVEAYEYQKKPLTSQEQKWYDDFMSGKSKTIEIDNHWI